MKEKKGNTLFSENKKQPKNPLFLHLSPIVVRR
jgi:hypothetical protein